MMASRSNLVFVGLKGSVVAVDRGTGETIWETSLKGAEFVTVTMLEADLFAATRGRVYRLDPSSGAILWVNDLAGLGWGIVSIAGTAPAAGAAETQRRAQAAAAAA